MKTTLHIALTATLLVFFVPLFVYAQEPMKLLSGFPGISGGATAQGANIVPFLNVLFNVLLIGAAILAVIFIMIGGFEIMTRDSPFHISEGKNRIYNALIGLFIILGSYLILITINPDLVRLDIFKNLQPINIARDPGTDPPPPANCPNTVCEREIGENATNCPADCGPPPPTDPPR